jgi:hypothetical protein
VGCKLRLLKCRNGFRGASLVAWLFALLKCDLFLLYSIDCGNEGASSTVSDVHCYAIIRRLPAMGNSKIHTEDLCSIRLPAHAVTYPSSHFGACATCICCCCCCCCLTRRDCATDTLVKFLTTTISVVRKQFQADVDVLVHAIWFLLRRSHTEFSLLTSMGKGVVREAITVTSWKHLDLCSGYSMCLCCFRCLIGFGTTREKLRAI